MDKVTITLPRATVTRMRCDALNQTRARLRSVLGTYGAQRDGSTDAEVAQACRDYLAVYDGFTVPEPTYDLREAVSRYYDREEAACSKSNFVHFSAETRTKHDDA